MNVDDVAWLIDESGNARSLQIRGGDDKMKKRWGDRESVESICDEKALNKGNANSPYCFAHFCAGSQSSFAERSLRLPTRGRGFGPGGRDAVEAFDLRSQTKTARRKPVVATMMGAEDMWREEEGKERGREEGEAKEKMRTESDRV